MTVVKFPERSTSVNDAPPECLVRLLEACLSKDLQAIRELVFELPEHEARLLILTILEKAIHMDFLMTLLRTYVND